MEVTELFLANKNVKTKIAINQGGSWSGKTYNIISEILSIATTENNKIITIAGATIPHLKSGPMQDLEAILESNKTIKDFVFAYNKTERIYTFRNGTTLQFKSYLTFQDAKSGKRDYLFINEANGITFQIAKQLIIRTRTKVWIDFNPDAEFWAHEFYKKDKTATWIYSDHRTNSFVPQETRAELEALKEIDYELWKVYARGMTGKIEGLIYRNWSTSEDWPFDAPYCFGLDFGYNHPTALIQCAWTPEKLFARQLIYESNLTTADLINRMNSLQISRKIEMFSDSARPDTIEEIKRAGFNCKPADKSVKDGINVIKSKPLIVINSPGIVKELRTYKWKTDANGKPVDEPVKFLDDAMDALRYGFYNGMNKPKLTYKF